MNDCALLEFELQNLTQSPPGGIISEGVRHVGRFAVTG
jgi:hypothetical protein